MAFTVKNWIDSPSTATPLTAVALKDLETRLSSYSEAPALVTSPGDVTSQSASSTRARIGSVTGTRAGIILGLAEDANWYRRAAAVVKTDGQIEMALSLSVDQSSGGNRLFFGGALDTSLVRSAANTLSTSGGVLISDPQTSVASVTTARTGGAAAALPAAPVRYLAAKDENGNRMYLPAYS